MELCNYRLLDCWKFGMYFYLFIYFLFLGELKRLNDINFRNKAY